MQVIEPFITIFSAASVSVHFIGFSSPTVSMYVRKRRKREYAQLRAPDPSVVYVVIAGEQEETDRLEGKRLWRVR